MSIVDFERTITEPEVRYYYLNLTDDAGRRYGMQFPPHRTRYVVVDGNDRHTTAQQHHVNQIWGMLRNWFQANAIQPRMRVTIHHDPQERIDGLHVLHLATVGLASIPIASIPTPGAVPPAEFASEIPLSLEKQLEDFLAANLALVEPGLSMFRDEDGREGKQYPTDVGVIDLLCRRPNGDLLVIELKRGRGTDAVVGQISRYIGWVKAELARGAKVAGLILAHDRDDPLKYAVFAHENLSLKYFKVQLHLVDETELESRNVT